MKRDELHCSDARAQLSARLDGELGDDGALRAHLAGCPACRAHEHSLAALAHGFEALREPPPVADLWPRIERRLHPRQPLVLARAAAALVGFVGLGATAFLFERARPGPPHHLLERLGPAAGPDELFASVPEYRILRALPTSERTDR